MQGIFVSRFHLIHLCHQWARPTNLFRSIGIKVKVENKSQYQAYLLELNGLREELGVSLREDLYPGVVFSSNRDKEDWLPEELKPKVES